MSTSLINSVIVILKKIKVQDKSEKCGIKMNMRIVIVQLLTNKISDLKVVVSKGSYIKKVH